jgi:hypothetical protein
MTERELGDFSKWPLKDLMEKQRSFPVGHRIGSEIQAEIDRRVSEIDQRRSESNQRYTKIGAIVAIISFVLGAVYGLDRGIYLGSSDRVLPADDTPPWTVRDGTSSTTNDDWVLKTCRYLFITGITEKPAHGGVVKSSDPVAGGLKPIGNADRLYCRLFGE